MGDVCIIIRHDEKIEEGPGEAASSEVGSSSAMSLQLASTSRSFRLQRHRQHHPYSHIRQSGAGRSRRSASATPGHRASLLLPMSSLTQRLTRKRRKSAV